MNDNINESPAAVRAKILHLLELYPIISPTMLQAGLGPATKPKVWRPVLAELVTLGLVVEDEIPTTTTTERYNSYKRLHLPGVEVTKKKTK